MLPVPLTCMTPSATTQPAGALPSAFAHWSRSLPSKRTLVPLSAIFFLAGALAGRAGAQDAQTFHDGIVQANKRLKKAGFEVAQPLPALLAGNRDALPRFRAARDEAVRTVKDVEGQVKAL